MSNKGFWAPRPSGRLARRVHGVLAELQANHDSVCAAIASTPEGMHAASLRGKRTAYREAIALVEAIEDGRRLRRRNSRDAGDADV